MKTQTEDTIGSGKQSTRRRKLFSLKSSTAGQDDPPQTNPAHFEIANADANQIFVAGTFNGWRPGATPLEKRGDGKWAVDLSLRPGCYEYRFVVDGKWQDDPAAGAHVRNPFGGTNAVMNVAAV